MARMRKEKKVEEEEEEGEARTWDEWKQEQS